MSASHQSKIYEKSYTLVDLEPEELLQRLFSKYDFNNDQRISRFEFQDIFKSLTMVTGASFPNERDVMDIFNYLDVDGDQTISYK